MTQQIGSPITGLTAFNVNTLIPSLSESADIQEAFRLYHFGAPSGTGSGYYDTTNTNGAQLYPNSVAGALYSLQTQIVNLSGSLGIQASTFTAKGDLLTATGPSVITRFGIGTNGQVLTANDATGTGLEWSNPEVTLVNTATLQNKTFLAPRISSGSFIGDTNGIALIGFPATVTAAQNYIQVSNAVNGSAPTITAAGASEANISLNLVSKGTGVVRANGVEIVTLSGTQTLTNKTLTAPSVTQLYISDSVIVYEGATADAFETTIGVIDPTADRTINFPNVDGTVITTGNMTDLTAVTSLTATGNIVYHSVPESKSATYTLVLADDGKTLEMNAAGTFFIPTDASVNFPIGTQITVIRTGDAAVSIAAVTPGTTTVNATPGLNLRAKWSSATLYKRGANLWIAIGDLSA